MGGSAKQPKQTDEQRKNERLQRELMEQQLEDAKKPVAVPEIKLPKPLPPPPPPAVQGSADTLEAAQDARRKAARRTNAGRNTLFAGETGGYTKTGGNKTLLG